MLAARQVLLLALKLIGIGFWSLTISRIIKSVTTLSNPASVAYAQVRAARTRANAHTHTCASLSLSLPGTRRRRLSSAAPHSRECCIPRAPPWRRRTPITRTTTHRTSTQSTASASTTGCRRGWRASCAATCTTRARCTSSAAAPPSTQSSRRCSSARCARAEERPSVGAREREREGEYRTRAEPSHSPHALARLAARRPTRSICVLSSPAA